MTTQSFRKLLGIGTSLLVGLVFFSSLTAYAKDYEQDAYDTQSSFREEFFVQTLGAGFEGDLTTLTVKITDITKPLYLSNFKLKVWDDSSYLAPHYVKTLSPGSVETSPQCSGSACDGSSWATSTDYEVELDFTCRNYTFDSANYYALGMHGGNNNYNFRVLGSSSNTYADGQLKSGTTSFIADCYYGSNSSWGAWQYNQISTQPSVCHADSSVSDIFFRFGTPDTTPPSMNIGVIPTSPDGSNNWYITVPTISLSSEDIDLDHIEYSWESSTGVWTLYTKDITAPEGSNTLYYRASDLTGNISDVSSRLFKVDTTVPDIHVYVDPQDPLGDDNWYLNSPTISCYSSSLDADYLMYSWSSVTGPWTTYDLGINAKEGDNMLYCKSVDLASNTSTVLSHRIKLDTQKPDKVRTLKADFKEENEQVVLTWKIDDKDYKRVRIYRSTLKDYNDVSDFHLYDQSYPHNKYKDKNIKYDTTYYYHVLVYDDAGNRSGAEKVSIFIPPKKVTIINPPTVKGVSDIRAKITDSFDNLVSHGSLKDPPTNDISGSRVIGITTRRPAIPSFEDFWRVYLGLALTCLTLCYLLIKKLEESD